ITNVSWHSATIKQRHKKSLRGARLKIIISSLPAAASNSDRCSLSFQIVARYAHFEPPSNRQSHAWLIGRSTRFTNAGVRRDGQGKCVFAQPQKPLCELAPVHDGPPFPNVEGGGNFCHWLQAEEIPRASRTKQPLRCPAPRDQRKANNGKGGNDEKA